MWCSGMPSNTAKKTIHKTPQQTGFTVFAHLPTRFHHFDAASWVDGAGAEHLVLVKGDVAGKKNVLVRVQSECVTGDVFGSKRCDCYGQLQHALRQIKKQGQGIVMYLRQEGRGIGLANKIRAYHLQDQGADTVDANCQLGLPVDARHFSVAADALRALKVSSIRLLTNNPHKIRELRGAGLRVVRVPLITKPDRYNSAYLATKKKKLKHLL